MRTRALDKPKLGATLPPKIPQTPPSLAPYCQALVNRLGLASGAVDAPQVLGVTGCARHVGTSTVATGLATFVAEAGQHVLLVDACWQHPALARRFDLSHSEGLWDLLSGERDASQASIPTIGDRLCMLPAGRRRPDMLLQTGRPIFLELLSQWKGNFDLIVLDLPPAVPEEPLMSWTGALDGVLLVVEAEQTTPGAARRAAQTLMQCDTRVLGAVLNRCRSYLPRWLDS